MADVLLLFVAALLVLGGGFGVALIAQCLTDVKADAGNLPPGFSCFPGSNSGLALSGK